MCYTLLLSTTSYEDLSQYDREEVRFSQNIAGYRATDRLLYPNRWYVGSRTGCSCSFRHLYEPDLGFGVPEEWFPEEDADIQATKIFISLIRTLLAQGKHVDCIDTWENNSRGPFSQLSVNLSQIRDEEFRFFENHHFDFSMSS